jgi:carbon-monoxide dehydrogenase medium subunit
LIPAKIRYEIPTSAGEAAALLDGRAQLLGGGTLVVPALNRGESRPATVIDLRAAGLDRIERRGTAVRVGATCSYSDLLSSEVVADELPLLKTMARGVTGGRQILNQGTLGGSVAAARPNSDAPTVVVALGGRVLLLGPAGERVVACGDFFLEAGRTALGADELVIALEFPCARRQSVGYAKLKFGASSWPIVTAAAVSRGPEGSRWSSATVTLGGVAGTPFHVDLTDCMAEGAVAADRVRRAIRESLDSITAPWSDSIASADYRRAVAPAVGVRAVRNAATSTDEGET